MAPSVTHAFRACHPKSAQADAPAKSFPEKRRHVGPAGHEHDPETGTAGLQARKGMNLIELGAHRTRDLRREAGLKARGPCALRA